jgi:membrane protein DedA with SNARE-associated domain
MEAAFVAWLMAYRYTIIIPLTMVAGPLMMPLCGFLVGLGELQFLPAYALLVTGDFIGDITWYLVGKYGALKVIHRWGKYISLEMEHVERFKTLFNKHDTQILFISKITMGFGFALAVLVAAGIAHVPFRKYALLNLLGGFLWTGLLMGIGYFFGNIYLSVSENLRLLTIAALFIIFMLALYGFGRYVRVRFSHL